MVSGEVDRNKGSARRTTGERCHIHLQPFNTCKTTKKERDVKKDCQTGAKKENK
jgi:hypothetical protein